MDPGAVLVVIAVVLALPSSFMMLGGIISALIGWSSRRTAEVENEGSELIDLNY